MMRPRSTAKKVGRRAECLRRTGELGSLTLAKTGATTRPRITALHLLSDLAHDVYESDHSNRPGVKQVCTEY